MRGFLPGNREIRRLRDVLLSKTPTPGSVDGLPDGGDEIFRGQPGRVRGSQKNSTGNEKWQRKVHQVTVIGFRAEIPVFAGTGKRGGIEYDGLESSRFLCETAQPIKHIAVNEIVRGWIQPIVDEISASPIQILP